LTPSSETASCVAPAAQPRWIGMAAEELISRSEVTAMLFTFADISANVERIVWLLEDDQGEEEEIETDT
jgi:hypothetical protein